MSDIVERLHLKHENRENSYAWQEAIEAYEREREEAAYEIGQLRSALKALIFDAEHGDLANKTVQETLYASCTRARGVLTQPKVITSHVFPPIPDRQFDYCACYDGDDEAGPRGWGRTEQEAIKDLLETFPIDQPEVPSA